MSGTGHGSRSRGLRTPFRGVVGADAHREVASALRRYRAAAGPDVATAIARRVRRERLEWRLVAVDEAVIARAEQLVATEDVRALDAVHVATALVFRALTGREAPFITSDDRQRRAAVAVGLDVLFIE